jgi:quercetin dioxygenase-like cupin family protein
MKNINILNQLTLPVYLIIILSSFGYLLNAQTTEVARKPRAVVYKPGNPAEQLYDFGKARFLVDSSDTQGAWSLVELTEMPGYKTPLHRHATWDESFYVLEGTLTVNVTDSIYTLPVGSYILIPRGTIHGQANFGTTPVKVLLSITPSGFERHLKDRVELNKTVKPQNPEFPKRMDELRKKNSKYIEVLGPWNNPKK